MKIRKANGNGSLIVGIPKDMAVHMRLNLGSFVSWIRNSEGKWELIKSEV